MISQSFKKFIPYLFGGFVGVFFFPNLDTRFDDTFYIRSGLYYARKGDCDLAIADFSKALKRDFNDSATYIRRGICKEKVNDLQGSNADYAKVIKLNPSLDISQFYYNRGVAQFEMGFYHPALSDFNTAISINQGYSDYYIFRGNVKSKLNYSEEQSISDYNKAIQIDSKNLNALFNRAIAKKRIGDKKGACSDFRKASSLGSLDASNWVDKICTKEKTKNNNQDLFKTKLDLIALTLTNTQKYIF
tara:strand:+ start:1202 stop:1939 length:738 start_codon:yes stop_codon:yes gene_type:complete